MVMSVETITFVILLAPLVGIALNGLSFSLLKEPFAGWISTLMVTVSAIGSGLLLLVYETPRSWVLFHWMGTHLFEVNFGFYVDWLTVLMLLVVSVVSACVHLYSIE